MQRAKEGKESKWLSVMESIGTGVLPRKWADFYLVLDHEKPIVRSKKKV